MSHVDYPYTLGNYTLNVKFKSDYFTIKGLKVVETCTLALSARKGKVIFEGVSPLLLHGK